MVDRKVHDLVGGCPTRLISSDSGSHPLTHHHLFEETGEHTETMKEIVLRSVLSDPPGRLESLLASEEPEREVYADGETIRKIMKECEQELRHRMEAITALKELVEQQRKVISSLKSQRQETMFDSLQLPTLSQLDEARNETTSRAKSLSQSSGSDDSEFSKDQEPIPGHAFSLSPSDEDVMSALTYEEGESIWSSEDMNMEGHIKDVIESIQEQATQVNAVIALDKLQTTKHELHVATKELRHRIAEVGELGYHIKSLEERMATVELERDLYQAEASRTKADFKECMQHMAKLKTELIIATSGNPVEHDSPNSIAKIEPLAISQRAFVPSDLNVMVTPDKSGQRQLSDIVRNEPVWRDLSKKKVEDKLDLETPSTQDTDSTSRSPLFPDSHSTSRVKQDIAPRRRCAEARNLALCFWSHRNRDVHGKGPAFERMDDSQFPDESPKPSPLLRRRFKKGKKQQEKPPSGRQGIDHVSVQQEKLVKLNERLVETSRDADELRNRLHIVAKRYNTIISLLQQNDGTPNYGGSESQTDMIKQLSTLDREKREASAKILEKHTLIAKLQKEMAELLANLRDCSGSLPVQERVQL